VVTAELKSKINMLVSVTEQRMGVNKLKISAGETKYAIVRSVRKEQRGNVVMSRYVHQNSQ